MNNDIKKFFGIDNTIWENNNKINRSQLSPLGY